MENKVKEFLDEAYNYLVHYGELSQEERDEREAQGQTTQRTKAETLQIINNTDLFVDTYDVLTDELEYLELTLETVLQYNKTYKGEEQK